MRPLIGLDVDGVLYRWGRAVRTALRREFGVEVPEDEWFSRSSVTPEQWDWVWGPGVKEVFGTGESFPGSISAARELCQLGRVRVLTACPRDARGARVEWLRRRRVPYAEIRFVAPPRSGAVSSHTGKSGVKPHCDVYVDDSPGNVTELARNTRARLIVLVDHSWNRDDFAPRSRSPRVYRARGWDDVLAAVRAVKSGRIDPFLGRGG